MLDQFAEKIKSLLTTGHAHGLDQGFRFTRGGRILTRQAPTNQRIGILRAKAPGMGPLEGAAEDLCNPAGTEIWPSFRCAIKLVLRMSISDLGSRAL